MIKIIFLTAAITLHSISVAGQIYIKADTLMITCSNGFRMTLKQQESNQIIFASQKEYEASDLHQGYYEGCPLPFDSIDFDNYVLIGYMYQGSNCEKNISSSAIVEKDREKIYEIQFATCPANICRDVHTRNVWFLIDRPIKPYEYRFVKTQCVKKSD